ncbi:Hypothetical protein DPCES_3444 [Desulfitobacterium hafniense]|uniref:Prokaryotic membrane lipoprotein lipid attachment site profile n=1 Tax=Desulfitobacterium hafniense TaxID=49338 RepID=A0A098B4N7_DESHA|nr:hypothetical protein [Desulfitobacterium hafniense]CDX03330.1 Hypothetical protein DPCES_3444 [Desulfitobacterium hafniense]
MKRLMIILLCILSFIVSGCGSTTTSENTPKAGSIENTLKQEEPEKPVIPEPYTAMIDQLKKGDLEMAEKYADLTIKDFPDSPYVYNSYLIKNGILSSKMRINNIIFACISDGIYQINSSLIEPNEIDHLEKQIDFITDRDEKFNTNIAESSNYLLTNYSEDLISGEFEMESITPPEGLSYLTDSDVHELQWFSEVGYPLPKDVDIEKTIKMYPKIFYYDLFVDGKIEYPKYFFDMGSAIRDKSLAIEVFNKVLEITENDQYNEYRIKAEELLESMQDQDSK